MEYNSYLANIKNEFGIKHVTPRKEFKVIHPDETYRGMTYSDLIKDWWNWIFSAEPDIRQDHDIMFLRGNIGANFEEINKSLREKIIAGRLDMMTNPSLVYNRTNLLGMTISANTSLFLPVYDSQFVIGDNFEGKQLETSYECRVAARREFRFAAAVWANYMVLGEENKIVKKERITNGLEDFYVESSPFGLIISEKNKLKEVYDGDYLSLALMKV